MIQLDAPQRNYLWCIASCSCRMIITVIVVSNVVCYYFQSKFWEKTTFFSFLFALKGERSLQNQHLVGLKDLFLCALRKGTALAVTWKDAAKGELPFLLRFTTSYNVAASPKNETRGPDNPGTTSSTLYEP